MQVIRFLVAAFCFGMAALGSGAASGQDYPSKPIRIVTTGVGGGLDFMARLIAPGLTENLGQQVIVENRTSSVVPGEIVAKSQPDGYTLLAFGSILWIGPLLQQTPYDPVKDFAPVTLAVTAPNILAATPSLPINSVQQLIAAAKAKPGDLNYACGATGGSAHLAAELFKSMAGVNFVRVSYKSNGMLVTELIAGHVQLTFGTAGTVAPHLKSGKLKALAVTSAQPSALFPGLPTVAATLPGYESVSLQGLFAPARTPATTIDRLRREIVRVLNRADVKEKFFNAGTETVGSSPEHFAATIKSEMARLGKVIKDAGIRAE